MLIIVYLYTVLVVLLFGLLIRSNGLSPGRGVLKSRWLVSWFQESKSRRLGFDQDHR
jgi:hypothetical protein